MMHINIIHSNHSFYARIIEFTQSSHHATFNTQHLNQNLTYIMNTNRKLLHDNDYDTNSLNRIHQKEF